MQFDEISDFLEQTVERILKKTNQSSYVYNYFSFVFSHFYLSAVFMKFVASNWLSLRYFESSEIGLLFTQICGARTSISINRLNRYLEFQAMLTRLYFNRPPTKITKKTDQSLRTIEFWWAFLRRCQLHFHETRCRCEAFIDSKLKHSTQGVCISLWPHEHEVIGLILVYMTYFMRKKS